MAEIILSQAGAALGARLLPEGISVLGRTLSGAALGGAIGGIVGGAIDASLAPTTEGPRIKSLHILESREGAGLPLIYGRMRVGGQVIWASRFKESRTEQSAGKGGPTYSEYTYSVSFAVALCAGPITRIDRVWANGQVVTLSDVNWRLYSGDETQLPDPLIEAIEGSGEAPAYRGTAYIVFEDFPLDAYGSHLPQMSFEIVRADQTSEYSLSQSVDGVNIIPASGEFVYATSIVREVRFPGVEQPINMNNASGVADFQVSLDQLQSDLPKVTSAALTVAWYGDDVRAGACQVRPGVEQTERDTEPYGWSVSNAGRATARLLSRTDERPNFGGTPADQAVLEGIAALKSAGIAVTLSPFLMMDVPVGNGLPDPYGGSEQAAFPWRGRLTVEADGTASARGEIDAFVGADWGFGFRHFILHHARLAMQAGGVDSFLIGSEMIGLTRVRDADGRFPFVEALLEITEEVRAIVGPSVNISYAADWTEYGVYVPGDGSGDVTFPLDPLWASDEIDFVGIDWYPPVSDWRDGEDHLDYDNAFGTIEDANYLEQNMEGGEAYDWYYASAADRAAQIRTPIKDTAHGEDWLFRQKDLTNWWTSEHYPRPGGERASVPTGWMPSSKPIRLIELGFPAVDKGTNAPNVFYDPKSSESAFPVFSTGARDDLLQRRALAVANTYWRAKPMIEQVMNWAWDGRPWPDFPSREDVWSDGPNWQFGHWLNGRSGLIDLSDVVEDLAAKTGISVNARGLSGVVEGFGLDQVTSLARALAPLASAFEFSVIENESGLRAAHDGISTIAALSFEEMVEDSYRVTRTLLDKQPSGVTVSYISGDLTYDPAIAEARSAAAQTDLKVALSYPIVMGDGRARALAARKLADLLRTEAWTATLTPGIGSDLEVLDRVSLSGSQWIVQRLEEQGLERTLRMRAAADSFERSQSIEAPGVESPATIAADPYAVVIDGPALDQLEGASVLVAATGDPWGGPYPIHAGTELGALTRRAVIENPAGLGRLESALATGPLGRWDEVNPLDLYLPGETLASMVDAAVFAGGNRLLVEHDAGWELLAWRNAELIGEDVWRLSGLLRGLSGTPIKSAASGNHVVLVDDRLAPVAFSAEDRDRTLLWAVGNNDPASFEYQDKAGLPWRVGHLKAAEAGATFAVSWTPRGLGFVNNWALPESDVDMSFVVEAYANDVLVLRSEQSETTVALARDQADRVRVAAISADGRVGEWGSIPLPPA